MQNTTQAARVHGPCKGSLWDGNTVNTIWYSMPKKNTYLVHQTAATHLTDPTDISNNAAGEDGQHRQPSHFLHTQEMYSVDWPTDCALQETLCTQCGLTPQTAHSKSRLTPLFIPANNALTPHMHKIKFFFLGQTWYACKLKLFNMQKFRYKI